MNFGFDVDQKSLGETVAQLLADFPALTAPDLATPRDDAVWRALTDLGMFSLLVPERFGGVGLSLVDLALATEALGAGLAPPAIAATLAATDLIVRHGSEAQQRKWLPRIASGDLKVALAIQDADCGYEPEGVKTFASDGVISGRKILVAEGADAAMFLVLAQQSTGIAIVAIDRETPGVHVRPHDDIDPTSGLCAIDFDGAAVAADNVIGAAAPDRAVRRLLDVAVTIASGQLMGIATKMLDASVEYARTRVQFGQPIGAFQAIKHRCADLAVAVEAGRSAAYYAFWAVAEEAPDRARAASMAKAYCGEVARQACNDAIQIHGGMGFTWELGLHRYLRRAKVVEHAYGDIAYHNERVLADTLATIAVDGDRQRDAA